MQESGSGKARIEWLGRNHALWSILVKDLALEGNGLPGELKSQLLALGGWSMRYSTLAILQSLPLEPLIDVNRNIADGLAAQARDMPVPAGGAIFGADFGLGERGSSSFLKKRTKKLLQLWRNDAAARSPNSQKFLASFFQKRSASLLQLR